MKGFTLTLSTYSDIKKMTYEELSKWAAGIYAKGVKAGRDSVTSSAAFVASLREVFKSVYDIGETRAEELIKRLASIFAEESAKETAEGGGNEGKGI